MSTLDPNRNEVEEFVKEELKSIYRQFGWQQQYAHTGTADVAATTYDTCGEYQLEYSHARIPHRHEVEVITVRHQGEIVWRRITTWQMDVHNHLANFLTLAGKDLNWLERLTPHNDLESGIMRMSMESHHAHIDGVEEQRITLWENGVTRILLKAVRQIICSLE